MTKNDFLHVGKFGAMLEFFKNLLESFILKNFTLCAFSFLLFWLKIFAKIGSLLTKFLRFFDRKFFAKISKSEKFLRGRKNIFDFFTFSNLENFLKIN